MDRSTINVWQGGIAAKESCFQHYWDMLEQTEQQYANTMKNVHLRNRYVSVHAQLRIQLAKTVNIAPTQLRILKSKYGKPYLADFPNLAFNLSHTANKMVVASGYDTELGIDIEQCKPRTNLASLVDKCFASEEKDYWRQLPVSQQLPGFYRFWTRKEAFVKATGRGIALGLKQCVINPRKQSEFLRIPKDYGAASNWLIEEIEVYETIYGALVVKKI